MKRKTYGIENLMDWKAQISAGKAKVIVHFTGGAITAYGVTPAEFTTDNAFIQRVIEMSSYYREGRIKLLRESDLGGQKAPAAKATTAKATTEAKTVSVACLDDAVAYLHDTFGIATSRLRSKPAILAAASEKGVTFEGL